MEFEKLSGGKLNETLYRGRHKSGLMVYVLPREGFSKSYASFAARVGSVDNEFIAPGDTEPTKIPDGVAHFLEHKLFEQPDGSNSFDQYSKTGASANAFTSFDTTAYIFSSTDRFYENLEILLDFVGKPYFTDENVAKEQGIIGQEIRMYDDDANWRVYFNLLTALYAKHPIRNDIAGTVESIAEIDKELLYKCYNTFYNPSNMVLFTRGDIQPERVAALADKYVTAAPIGEIKRIFPHEPKGVAQKLVTQKLSVASPIFMLGFKDNASCASGRELLRKEITTEILCELLAGKSSKLYNRLYEKGLINDTFYCQYSQDSGCAYAAMGGESADPAAAREEIMFAIRSAELCEEDFQNCKKAMIGSFLRLFNNVEGVSNAFVNRIFMGIDLFEYLDVCEDITLDETRQRMEYLFNEENSAMSVIEANSD